MNLKDLISRQETINDLNTANPSMLWNKSSIEAFLMAQPSAYLKQKKGKCTKIETHMDIGDADWMNCSACGSNFYFSEREPIEHPNFCPYCGADMRGEQE